MEMVLRAKRNLTKSVDQSLGSHRALTYWCSWFAFEAIFINEFVRTVMRIVLRNISWVRGVAGLATYTTTK
jgi:hypothetical protein